MINHDRLYYLTLIGLLLVSNVLLIIGIVLIHLECAQL